MKVFQILYGYHDNLDRYQIVGDKIYVDFNDAIDNAREFARRIDERSVRDVVFIDGTGHDGYHVADNTGWIGWFYLRKFTLRED